MMLGTNVRSIVIKDMLNDMLMVPTRGVFLLALSENLLH